MSKEVADRRAEFWAGAGPLVWMLLACLTGIPVVLFCHSERAIFVGILAAMFGPFFFVYGMMQLRHHQYMRILDTEIDQLTR